MFQLILLAFLMVHSSQLCQKCEVCSSPSNDSSICKCDADCGVFGDCCGSLSPPNSCPPPTLSPLLPGAVLECQSIYFDANIPAIRENEGYLTVSSCPTCSEDIQVISEALSNCTSKDVFLPPVTDLKTGIVYRNEYCAYCNGVEELKTWQIELVCGGNVQEVVLQSNLSEVVDNDPMIFQRECQERSFRRPSLPPAISPPRSCIPTINVCLAKANLEKIVGNISSLNYEEMERNCSDGTLDPIEGINGLLYKNPSCAICNAAGVKKCVSNIMFTYRIQNKQENSSANSTSPSVTERNKHIIVATVGSNIVSLSIDLHGILLHMNCLKGNASVAFQCHNTPCTSVDAQGTKNCLVIFMEIELKCYLNLTNCISMKYVLNNTLQLNLNSSVDIGFSCAAAETCPHGYVLINASLATNYLNGSIIHEGELLERWYINEELQVFICMESRQDLIMLICHYVAHSSSVVGVSLTILTYYLFKELRTLPSTVIIFFSIPIFLNSFLHLFTGKVGSITPSIRVALAIAFHYLQLTQLTWMSIFSCEVLRKLYLGWHCRVDPRECQRKSLITYLLVGWCSALVIVVITVIVNFTSNGLVQYGLNDRGMYILHFTSYIIAVGIPGMLCVFFSVISFFIVTVLLYRQARLKNRLKQKGTWRLFRLWIAVMSVSGLTYLPYLVSHPLWSVHMLDYFHESQGFFIFTAFFLSKKIFTLYFRCVKCKDKSCNFGNI